jgi:hypothetical protein
MHKYIIERDMPGIGSTTAAERCAAAQRSNEVLSKVGPGIQWVESFLTPDKLFCIYLSDSVDKIRTHAEQSGFPATAIHQIRTTIDPTSADPL